MAIPIAMTSAARFVSPLERLILVLLFVPLVVGLNYALDIIWSATRDVGNIRSSWMWNGDYKLTATLTIAVLSMSIAFAEFWLRRSEVGAIAIAVIALMSLVGALRELRSFGHVNGLEGFVTLTSLLVFILAGKIWWRWRREEV